MTALAYPEKQIFVLFLTEANEVKLKNSILTRTLLGYKNVRFKYLNMQQFSKNTPLEAFLKNGTLEASNFRVAHTSDVLRHLTLWKFGGTYFDLDVIVFKRTTLSNYCCFEEHRAVNGAILNLDRNLGKQIAVMLMKYYLTR